MPKPSRRKTVLAKATPTLRYAKPKLLLIDMDAACAEALNYAGFNVSTGTFGAPYNVKPSDTCHPIPRRSWQLPNVEEQEIIFANLERPTPVQPSAGDKPGTGVVTLFQSGVHGSIDPRPHSMDLFQSEFDRILRHGGIFTLFLGYPYDVTYIHGYLDHSGWFRTKGEDFSLSSRSFLSDLGRFGFRGDNGREIELRRDIGHVGVLFQRLLSDAYYRCVMDPPTYFEHRWYSLMTNKYGDCVGGILFSEKGNGCLLLLPQCPSFADVILEFVESFCINQNSSLFPFHDAQPWLHDECYEIPEVVCITKKIKSVEADALKEIEILKQEIEQIRDKNPDWYTLLNGTGDKLVQAVIHSLREIGFQQVVDVDDDERSKSNDRALREDIRVHDRDPTLIVDVKGVGGKPEDAEATQAEKHANMRRCERDFGEVKPLTIINHQRNLPPSDRDTVAYRPEIVRNAELTGLGLMTTWDLFRIARNVESNSWPRSVVLPIFYRNGRIQPVPEHYEEVGEIVRTWEDAFGIVPTAGIQTGMYLAVESHVLFDEFVVESLQVEDRKVDFANSGENCGVGLLGAKQRFHKGQRVFIVRSVSDDVTTSISN